MTIPTHPSGPMPAPAAAWAKVRAMGDIEFTPLSPAPTPVSQPPRWLQPMIERLAKWIGPPSQWLAQHWRMFEVAAVVIVVLTIAGVIVVSLQGRRRKPRASVAPAAWQPDAAKASALLADADQLAAGGRFDEAVHLLLRRSFDDIGSSRPDWLTPASTAREISGLPSLPAAARLAFAVIAGEVERSRYALRPLGYPDWERARAAYAQFAVPART